MAHRPETCLDTGVMIPECSCMACARALMKRHADQSALSEDNKRPESPAEAALGSVWRAIADPASRPGPLGETSSAVTAIRRAFPRHFAVR